LNCLSGLDSAFAKCNGTACAEAGVDPFSFCAVDVTGKSFCAYDGRCDLPCITNADCDALVPGARCAPVIQCCPASCPSNLVCLFPCGVNASTGLAVASESIFGALSGTTAPTAAPSVAP
jgi:hypothetical protein